MLRILRYLLYKILIRREEEEMMALLFAQRVILGKTEFSEVPAKLKQDVARILVEECGLPELVTEEEYLPKVEA